MLSIQTTFIRKFISASLCTVIGFTALGFGQAGHADAATHHKAYTTISTKADRIIRTGKRYLGVKYRFGAPSGVTYAFDCSSFTQFIFKRNGISLPRVSSQQATRGVKVSRQQLKRGDLVFFRTPHRTGSRIGHVAVYLGNNKILHTYGRGGVRINSLTGYWKKNYVTARRVIRS